ncbi:CMRF35-like molecule 1 isoform X2 [Monodon monoceros]|uniref:CMRF35-like molecule 1 isoform X2 n=1 Tax=Monodon monoceros TaxID=40151 RepID=UPI0010F9D6F0|nr:CMRF35-like molecule 1 isoform X2 [Monodon monoceros]
MHLLLLFYLLRRLAGSSAITGPKAVSSLERGSLTVQCQYSPGWEKHVKWWCRGAAWSSCEFVVKTTEPEKEVKKDRVSIRDNRKNRTIAVTMEKLRLNDADTYWCGIERFGTDLGVQVKVTIDPAPTAVPATTPVTSAINTFTVPVSLEQTSDSLAVTSPGSNSGVFLRTSTLLPFISAVLLLLLMVASLVVWRMMKQQKKGEGTWLTPGWGWAGWKCVGLMASMVIREPSAQGNTCTVWKGCRPKGHSDWKFEGLELGGEPRRFWTQFYLAHPSLLLLPLCSASLSVSWFGSWWQRWQWPEAGSLPRVPRHFSRIPVVVKEVLNRHGGMEKHTHAHTHTHAHAWMYTHMHEHMFMHAHTT